MLYQYYALQRASLEPMRLFASGALSVLGMPGNPIRDTALGRLTAATLDHFEHNTQNFDKPSFGHRFTVIDGEEVACGATCCDSDARPIGRMTRNC
jgi:poly(3-hydroxybutyrate) depolymerase